MEPGRVPFVRGDDVEQRAGGGVDEWDEAGRLFPCASGGVNRATDHKGGGEMDEP